MSTTKKSNGFTMIPRYNIDSEEDNTINLKRVVGKSKPLRSPDHFKTFENTNTISQNHLRTPYQDRVSQAGIDDAISMTMNQDGSTQSELEEVDVNKSYVKFLNSDFDYNDIDNYVEDNDEDYEFSDGDETYYDDEYTEDEEEEENYKYLDDLEREKYDYEKGTNLYDEKIKENQANIGGSIPYEKSNRKTILPTTKSKSFSTISNFIKFITIVIISFMSTLLIFLIKDGPQNFMFGSFEEGKLTNKIKNLEELLNNQNYEIEFKFNKLESQINSLKLDEKSNEIYPITLKHGQVQVSPEFHQFLYQFLETYQSSNSKPISTPALELNELVFNSIESAKTEIETNLENKLKFLDFNKLNQTVQPNNPIILNTIIESVLQNSNYINYADFNTGARILGFLTSTTQKNEHLIKKLFLGWLDLFKTNENFETNANHVIIDDDYIWKGGDEIGIRLSKSIIPTDIVVELIEPDKSVDCEIGFKPKSKAEFEELKFPIINSSNVYSSKFKFIKGTKLANKINHIKLPLRFLNYQIFGRDLYFKFSTNVDLKSIKVYGINEFNIDKLDSNLKRLFEKSDDKIDGNISREHYHGSDDKVYDLNDDIYV
ncbi:uncharacterized protein KGF55_005395 [Candida pseudojiufengensis]|uniref:uncharacterized protein n=1 Tax=Candida pseudojiufengensis TaxID=497109 RepID=UPI0022255986|nr:uncharacterized protein KGF55_005395 [Candida pseudojiufengensis]KAI5959418.1 hypothetical protein KGF55_005395 [Candida pseudojiufengensis]